jgi:hypothetical protein
VTVIGSVEQEGNNPRRQRPIKTALILWRQSVSELSQFPADSLFRIVQLLHAPITLHDCRVKLLLELRQLCFVDFRLNQLVGEIVSLGSRLVPLSSCRKRTLSLISRVSPNGEEGKK